MREAPWRRLLDPFCGGGGAAVGYLRAGFNKVIGIDVAPQPFYPGGVVRQDAIEALWQLVIWRGWDRKGDS